MLASSTVKFAGYRVEGIAGRGGMGVVYRATQLGLDRPVALKVGRGRALGDPRIRERFLRESRAAARSSTPTSSRSTTTASATAARTWPCAWSRAPTCARVAAAGRWRRSGRVALSPRSPTRSTPRTRPAWCTATSSRRTSSLGAHDRVYLWDFGLASHALSDRRADAHRAAGVGTPSSWRPSSGAATRRPGRGRLLAGLRAALRADRAGGPTPAGADEARLWAHLHAAPPEPSRLVPGVPAAFDEVIRRALEKRPDARFSSAGELGAAALTAAGHPTVARTKRTVPTPACTERNLRDLARPAPARPAPARPRGGRSDGRLCGRPRRLPLDPRLRKRRSPDQRAAEHHDDRGRGGQAARRQGTRHPRPARRPRRPRRHAAGQRRGRRRQRLGGQHGVTDARPRRAPRSPSPPWATPRLRHHGHHQTGGESCG